MFKERMHNLSWLYLSLALFGVGCGAALNADDRSAALQVDNLSDFTICDVHLAARGQPDWGVDQLDPGESILPEQSRRFRVAAGRWAVRMDDCRGRAMFVKRDVRIVGTRRIGFRPVEVQRDPRFGQRRFANGRAGVGRY